MTQGPVNQDVEIKKSGTPKQKDSHDEAIRFLAFVLRHRPHAARIKLNEDGWAELSKVTQAMVRIKHIKMSEQELVEMVNTKAKNAFILSEDFKMIRAKSGHTVLLGFTVTDKLPDTLHLNIYRNQMAAVMTDGLTMKPGSVLTTKSIVCGKNEVGLSIKTNKAVAAKVKFYSKDESFFAFHVPKNCITFSSL